MRYDPNMGGDGGNDCGPVPDGEYPFTVLSAKDKQSNGGNAMLEINLLFDVGRPDPMKVRDWLVAHPKAIWKIRQFCGATGFNYDSGELDADSIVGAKGKAKLILGQPKSEGGKRYMQVEAYIADQATDAQSDDLPTGDDIPF